MTNKLTDLKGPKKKEEVEDIMMDYRTDYGLWKDKLKEDKKGFFMIYNSFLEDGHLKNISGNALRVYVYLGIYSKNNTGESWHSVERISDYFGADKRSVKRWLKELEDKNLIVRIQKGFNRVSNTFLRPYD